LNTFLIKTSRRTWHVFLWCNNHKFKIHLLFWYIIAIGCGDDHGWSSITKVKGPSYSPFSCISLIRVTNLFLACSTYISSFWSLHKLCLYYLVNVASMLMFANLPMNGKHDYNWRWLFHSLRHPCLFTLGNNIIIFLCLKTIALVFSSSLD
jgi:hypothetical protein